MPRPIRVAIDIRDLRIAKTGVKTYLEELVTAFKNQDGNNFRFFFFDTSIPVYTGRGKFLKLVEHLRFLLWKQLILPFKAWINNCDIIFCADFFVPYFSPGARTIPVLHDAFFFEYPQHYNKRWLFLFKTIGISAAKKAAVVVTPTLYTKQRISALSGIPETHIEVVYEGPKSFPLKGQQEHPLPGSKYLLHVGVVEKRKNLLNLLKAFLMLLEDHKDLKLVLIGQFSPKSDMDDRLVISRFIKSNQLEDQVIMPGYVPDDALSAWYKNAALYVFPSINEGFGIPVLEAFSHHLPVLIANNSCLPEVAGDAAVQFDPFDPQDIYLKLKLVVEDEALQNELRQKGSIRGSAFSWKRTADQLLSIFKDVAEKNHNFRPEKEQNA